MYAEHSDQQNWEQNSHAQTALRKLTIAQITPQIISYNQGSLERNKKMASSLLREHKEQMRR